MTTEEKLQHFYDVSVNEAKAEAEKLLEAHRADLERQFAAHKSDKEQELHILLKSESEHASRDMNKALSASQLEIRRSSTSKVNTMKERLFDEVRQLLEQFMDTPEYEEYLVSKITAAENFAGDDTIHIYLSPRDSARAERLSQRTGAALALSETDFLGGIQAVIPDKNILIDDSFLGALENEQRDFTFSGGQTHE